ncbi:hypothetical protein BGP79_04640 [Tersicoccus sp. Bi-70]|nr:hypothetical protein BGP79_04640 [Tersicoccus sp. Bi-70]
MEAARVGHERWVEAHPRAFDDPDAPGLSRAERLAVADRSGVAEIAGALQISEGAVHTLLRRAALLADHLPRTGSALVSGAITAKTADLIADATTEYSEALADAGTDEAAVSRYTRAIAAMETGLLDAADRGCTPARLHDRARRLREAHHPRSFTEREHAARACRYVRVTPDQDGMAHLFALLPAATVWSIDQRLTILAHRHHGLHKDDADARRTSGDDAGGSAGAPADRAESASVENELPRPTVAQLRADVLADLLAGSGAQTPADEPSRTAGDDGAGPAPRVLLTVPAETLLGGEQPGVLGPFGPIPAAAARDLAARAMSLMLGVTATTLSAPRNAVAESSQGCGGPVDARVLPVLATDGGRYRIPAALRRALAVRDGTCRFPGCRRNATGCDLDHVVAWADGGATTAENLAHLCRKHHVLKHHSGWTAEIGPPRRTGPPGTDRGPGNRTADRLVWTSPAGRRYTSDPDGIDVCGVERGGDPGNVDLGAIVLDDPPPF